LLSIMPHSVRSWVAIGSALCIWASVLLLALQAFDLTGGTQPDWYNNSTRTGLRGLQPNYLRSYWNWKRSQLGVDVSINLFAALGLSGLAYCVLILKRVFKRYSGGESDLPAFMAGCFFIGAILPAIQFVQSLGYTQSADLISQWAQLPDAGIQSLQVAYTLARGSTYYIFSCQFVFISIGLTLSSVLSWRTGELPKKHAVVGFITAAFGYLTFLTEIIQFNVTNIGTGVSLGIFLVLYGIIFLPIWTIWLGVELRRIKIQSRREKELHMDESLTGNSINMEEKK